MPPAPIIVILRLFVIILQSPFFQDDAPRLSAGCVRYDRPSGLRCSFIAFAFLKWTTIVSGAWTDAPVCGLTANLAGFLLVAKKPKPRSSTRPLLTSAALISSSI